MSMLFTDLYDTVVNILVTEADDVRLSRISQLEADIAKSNIDIGNIKKRYDTEIKRLETINATKQREISRLRQELVRSQSRTTPEPAAAPKAPPTSTPATPAVSPASTVSTGPIQR